MVQIQTVRGFKFHNFISARFVANLVHHNLIHKTYVASAQTIQTVKADIRGVAPTAPHTWAMICLLTVTVPRVVYPAQAAQSVGGVYLHSSSHAQ